VPHQMKLATCCYCGVRTTLKLTARHGHELACGSCGAPLHEMKPLKVDATPQTPPRSESQFANTAYRKKKADRKSYHKPRKQERRKSFFQRALSEVWDEIEDIFD